MRDDDQRAVELLQRDGECVAHIEVKVVGRLVQQQQMRLLPNQQCQCEAGFFTTGEIFDGFGHAVALKVKTAEVVAQHLDVGIGCEFLHMPQRRFVLAQGVQMLLRKVADAQVLRGGDFAGQWCQLLCERFDQGRFTRAVHTEQADAVVALDAEGDFL